MTALIQMTITADCSLWSLPGKPLCVDCNPVAPGFLGSVHGPIRLIQQRVERDASSVQLSESNRDSNPDASGSRRSDLCIRHGCAESLRNTAGGIPFRFDEDGGELLSAGAAKDVRATQRIVDQMRHLLQNNVANGVAPGVVDRFEVVDVEHQQREGSLEPRCTLQFTRRGFNEAAAIEEPGQAICLGLKFRLPL